MQRWSHQHQVSFKAGDKIEDKIAEVACELVKIGQAFVTGWEDLLREMDHLWLISCYLDDSNGFKVGEQSDSLQVTWSIHEQTAQSGR